MAQPSTSSYGNAKNPNVFGPVQTSQSVFSVGEAEVKEDVPPYRRHKHLFTCCGVFWGFIVLLGIVILILSFTVFKTKQPVITIDNVVLETFRVNLSNIDASVNLTLGVDVSVWNPNHASFKYTNSTSYMFYRSSQVGEAPIPAGRIGARGIEKLTTSLKLNASRVLSNPYVFSDLLVGSFPISTTAEVSGRVNILNIFKHHARSSSYCSMSVSVATRSVQNMTCTSHVKL